MPTSSWSARARVAASSRPSSRPRGRSVVVLEAGPFVDEPTMPAGELEAFDRLYLDRGLVSTWDGSVTILAGAAVGGGTLVNWMTCIAAPASVRDEWAPRPRPRGPRDGAAWSRRCRRGRGRARRRRVHPTSRRRTRSSCAAPAALGWEAARPGATPTAAATAASCPFGCRRGAKRSGIRVHLADGVAARARGSCQTRAVARVLIEQRPGRRRRGASRSADGRRRSSVRAARSSSRRARSARPPSCSGPGSTHPAIGRYLRLHPVPVVGGLLRRARSRCGAARCRPPARSSSSRPSPAGTATSSNRRRATPGCSRSRCRGRARTAHAEVMAGIRHRRPADRGHPGRRRGRGSG